MAKGDRVLSYRRGRFSNAADEIVGARSIGFQLHGSIVQLEFAVAFEKLAQCVDILGGRFESSLGARDTIQQITNFMVRLIPESLGLRPAATNLNDALLQSLQLALVLIEGLADEFGEVSRDLQSTCRAIGRLLILTATDLEDTQLVNVLRRKGVQIVKVLPLEGMSVRYFGVHRGISVFHARSSAGASGTMGSSSVTQEAISSIKPDFVVSAGICFGMQEGKYKLADVMISSRVRLYEPQRVTTVDNPSGDSEQTTITPRGDLLAASHILIDRLRSLRMLNEYDFKIGEGIILSGDKLVDSKAFIDQLRAIEPEAIAGEMEATGVAAISQRLKKDWIVVKGICDWGHGKDKTAQATAASNAFLLVADLVLTGELCAQPRGLN